MTKADITRRVIPLDNGSIYDAQIVSIGVCGTCGVCQTERNCLRPRGMQIVSIGACTSPTEVIFLVFSPPHMFSPMATISLEFGHIQKGGALTKLRWLPSHGDPVEEPVGLWVQPDSVRARVMTMCILAGSIDNTMLDEVLKLRPDIETNTWSSLVGKLLDGAEKEIRRQVVKSKRVPGLRRGVAAWGCAVQLCGAAQWWGGCAGAQRHGGALGRSVWLYKGAVRRCARPQRGAAQGRSAEQPWCVGPWRGAVWGCTGAQWRGAAQRCCMWLPSGVAWGCAGARQCGLRGVAVAWGCAWAQQRGLCRGVAARGRAGALQRGAAQGRSSVGMRRGVAWGRAWARQYGDVQGRSGVGLSCGVEEGVNGPESGPWWAAGGGVGCVGGVPWGGVGVWPVT